MFVVSGEPRPGPLRVGGRGWGRPEPGLSSAWQTCCANAKLPTYRKFIQIYILDSGLQVRRTVGRARHPGPSAAARNPCNFKSKCPSRAQFEPSQCNQASCFWLI